MSVTTETHATGARALGRQGGARSDPRIRVAVAAEDAGGFALQGSFEVRGSEELEEALGEAAEELLEAGIDPVSRVWVTVAAEFGSAGRAVERRREIAPLGSLEWLGIEMGEMGLSLAAAASDTRPTPHARVEIDGIEVARAEGGWRDVVLGLRGAVRRLWKDGSAPRPLARARVVLDHPPGDASEAELDVGGDRDEFAAAVQHRVSALWHEAEMTRLQRERDEERARLEAERAATRVRLLAEARAHPDWGAFLDWAAENERFVDSCENALGRGRAWNANLVAAHQSGAVGGGRDLDPAHLRLLELLLRIECEDASAWR